MSCRDLISARWTVGGQFVARQKKFVKFDNAIPGLYVKIDFGTCDIDGWTLRAYFKYPGMLETDPCIFQEQLVTNNEATFDLDGTLFGTYGIWEIELVLIGLAADPDKESKATGNSITYEVIKNCEGLEVPPIPPEDTCNTVDELIQALRDIIDEGNLANTTWNATITAGNTANDNWNLTITAGNNAQTQWNITIAAGNAANLVWLQTIADGEVLKAEIEALIAGGDLIQKGAGFDDVKYPFLKDVTDDLEEKIYSLDSRLVFAFDPSKMNIENLKYGMYVKNPLTNGDGTVWSEDVDSMAGVFNDEDGNFYCGEGYTVGNEPVGAPIVKESAPDGKLIIKEGWTSETNSFIFGFVLTETLSPNRRIYVTTTTGAEGTTERLAFSAVPVGKFGMRYYVFVADNLAAAIFEDGSEYACAFLDRTLPSSVINLTSNNPNWRNNDVICMFSYYDEGNKMTEQELRNELAKIKSGKFIVENTGVYEPIQGAKKRANEYGQTKNYVMLESQSTDIQLVETNKKVYTTADDGTVRIDRIDNSGVITNISGGAGVENVGGYIRLTVVTSPSASTKVKVVIEIVE